MSDNLFLTAPEVAKMLGISVAFAYKIMRDLNEELKAKGFIVVSGRVNRQYFLERTCYGVSKPIRKEN
ncbi:MAG TPA: DNA-binding protein [Ruminococcus sp.]|nr:DNA-binding protein [Ruminococcus sp.]